MGELNRWDVQMLMLTATMPVHMEDEFRRRMGIVEVAVSSFRDTTTRKNIAYRVHQLTSTTFSIDRRPKKKNQPKQKHLDEGAPPREEGASIPMNTVAYFI